MTAASRAIINQPVALVIIETSISNPLIPGKILYYSLFDMHPMYPVDRGGGALPSAGLVQKKKKMPSARSSRFFADMPASGHPGQFCVNQTDQMICGNRDQRGLFFLLAHSSHHLYTLFLYCATTFLQQSNTFFGREIREKHNCRFNSCMDWFIAQQCFTK